jgi:hypothetical protein
VPGLTEVDVESLLVGNPVLSGDDLPAALRAYLTD